MRTEKQKAAHAAYMRDYYADPVRRAKRQEDQRQRYAENPDRFREQRRDQYRNNEKYRQEQKVRAAVQHALVKTAVQEARKTSCADCGGDFDPVVMQFHHLDPATKKYNVSSCPNLKLLKCELAKCIVICANCHCLRHNGEYR